MISEAMARRAFLEECGSALLLSATAYSTLTTTTYLTVAARGRWPSAPVMTSIASCGVTGGDQILAIGCVMARWRHDKRPEDADTLENLKKMVRQKRSLPPASSDQRMLF